MRHPLRRINFRIVKIIVSAFLSLAVAAGASAQPELLFQSGPKKITELSRPTGSTVQPKLWVVQFTESVATSTTHKLAQAGITVLRYFPEQALLVKASEQQLTDYLALGAGQKFDFALFPITEKLSPELAAAAVSTAGRLILWAQGFNDELMDQALRRLGAIPTVQVLNHNGTIATLAVSPEFLLTVASAPEVEWLSMPVAMTTFYFPLTPDSVQSFNAHPIQGTETGTQVMNVPSAWGRNLLGQGETVSFADTGLDRGEVGLLSADFREAVVKGHTKGIGARNWADPMGHGTHVAGSIAGRGILSEKNFQGAAPGAMLLPQGMWSPILENLTVPPKLQDLFGPAHQDGARLHSNSWGSPRNLGAYDGMAQQVDDFAFKNQDFLPIFAAGNSGVDKDKNGVIDQGSVSSPGTAKNALTVGASENLNALGGIQRQIKDLGPAKDNWPAEPIWSSRLSDQERGIAVFSSRGPTRDGRLKPEVVAPGTNILSAKSKESGAQDLWGAYNADYVYSGGTSMSTPLVAGSAAIVREYLRVEQGMAQPSAALVKAVLMNTAVDLAPGQYGTGRHQEIAGRPDMNQGFGRVDMAWLSDTKTLVLVDEVAGLTTGQTREVEVRIDRLQRLLINLVYTDAPGSPSAAVSLVNNLDLRIQFPDGRVVERADRQNNHEFAEIEASVLGVYKLAIVGKQISVPAPGRNGQPFALVVREK